MKRLLVDETADPVERSSAATKLLSDGFGKDCCSSFRKMV